MRYTVAIPVYNGARYVREAIASALAQDACQPYEVLVVDNASTDDTADILRAFNARLRVVRNPTTLNMYENHNECLRQAIGDHVVFCHADDVLEPKALAVIDEALGSVPSPEKTVLWGRSLFRDFARMLEISGLAMNQVFNGPKGVRPFLYYGLSPSGTCYPRQALLDAGGFVYTAHPLCPNDWMTMIFLALKGFSFLMRDQLYCRRKFSSTLPDETPRRQRLQAGEAAIRDLRKVLTDEEVMSALTTAFTLKFPPLAFYHACIKNSMNPSAIKVRLGLKTIRFPLLWRDPLTILTLLA